MYYEVLNGCRLSTMADLLNDSMDERCLLRYVGLYDLIKSMLSVRLLNSLL